MRTHLYVDRAQADGDAQARRPHGLHDADRRRAARTGRRRAGEFYVRVKYAGFDNPAYGPVAFATSARSAVLTDWPGGGFVGIHGTNEPEILPGRVSHGCIRMRNDAILKLARLMKVGTPLTIR